MNSPKILKTLLLVGSSYPNSACGRRGWRYSPGYAQALFADNTQRYLGDISFRRALEELEQQGVDCSTVRAATGCTPAAP